MVLLNITYRDNEFIAGERSEPRGLATVLKPMPNARGRSGYPALRILIKDESHFHHAFHHRRGEGQIAASTGQTVQKSNGRGAQKIY